MQKEKAIGRIDTEVSSAAVLKDKGKVVLVLSYGFIEMNDEQVKELIMLLAEARYA